MRRVVVLLRANNNETLAMLSNAKPCLVLNSPTDAVVLLEDAVQEAEPVQLVFLLLEQARCLLKAERARLDLLKPRFDGVNREHVRFIVLTIITTTKEN